MLEWKLTFFSLKTFLQFGEIKILSDGVFLERIARELNLPSDMVESEICLYEFKFGETPVTMTGSGVVNKALKKPLY
jgi:hypothetical protein